MGGPGRSNPTGSPIGLEIDVALAGRIVGTLRETRDETGETMKAILMDEYGGPEVLHLGEAPDPTAGPGEIVVEIHAASVNGADWKVREGLSRGTVALSFPHILGRDFSGVVRALGAGVRDFAPGNHVFAVIDRGQEGGYAEAFAIQAALAAKKPDTLSHAHRHLVSRRKARLADRWPLDARRLRRDLCRGKPI